MLNTKPVLGFDLTTILRGNYSITLDKEKIFLVNYKGNRIIFELKETC